LCPKHWENAPNPNDLRRLEGISPGKKLDGRANRKNGLLGKGWGGD